MSQEILDQIREIERDKGIEAGQIEAAVEDALLAAYKKTPGAARHATVELDERGDYRVYSIELPADLEERLLDEARERALDELERIEEETGERNHTLLSDDDLEIEWDEVPEDLLSRVAEDHEAEVRRLERHREHRCMGEAAARQDGRDGLRREAAVVA